MDASSPDPAPNPATSAAPAPAPAKDAAKAVTPMMAQYMAIKEEAQDALLFYRMGDFYELFFEDAEIAAGALDIALTKRGKHQGTDIPMCGVPFHSYEAYLARLIRKGFSVAVCEQVEDPAEAKKRGAKSVVARAIVRVVTPGTLTEDTLLDAGANNFLGALAVLRSGDAALAYADVSTGEAWVRSTTPASFPSDIAAAPFSELVVSEAVEADENWAGAVEQLDPKLRLTRQPAVRFDSVSGEKRIKEAFAVAALDGFGAFSRADHAALGALLAYLQLTQVDRMPALRPPKRASGDTVMAIDQATRGSLEILSTQSGERRGSLLHAVDRTKTGAGARLLAQRLSAPSTAVETIRARHDAVAFFRDEDRLCETCRDDLSRLPDMARALSRLSLERGGPRDLIAIRQGLVSARDIASRLGATDHLPKEIDEAMRALEARDNGGFATLITTLREALQPEAPMLARDGGFIAKGFDPGLDAVRALRDDSRRVIANLEAQYREETGVKSLKIKHNNVLGYFIETTPANADALMADNAVKTFIHRQTLASAVRFTTTELADLDAKIARSRDEALARELALFAELSKQVMAQASEIAHAADGAAVIDVSAALAILALEENYVRPKIDDSFAFKVTGGRHPVVEQAVRREGASAFIANDCCLGDDKEGRLWLVTGPNMAGKSTFLRQNALIAILAQAGAFVPADDAHIGVADRVFSRVGASDDIARGRSTFMVEMVETAAILNQAGPRALVVLDEIGRGTSTFDGMSIAWASVEHLHDVNKCRGLFATHYHELTALAEKLTRLENVSMKVREWKDDVVFLHEVASGPADRSYGVAVGRLAGLPKVVVDRASRLLKELEEGGDQRGRLDELPLFAASAAADPPPAVDPRSALDNALSAIHPDELSPREALELIYRLKEIAHTDND